MQTAGDAPPSARSSAFFKDKTANDGFLKFTLLCDLAVKWSYMVRFLEFDNMKVGALSTDTITTLLAPTQLFSVLPVLEEISRQGFIKHKNDSFAKQLFFGHYNSLKKAFKGLSFFIEIAVLAFEKPDLQPAHKSFLKPKLAMDALAACAACMNDSFTGKLGKMSNETFYEFTAILDMSLRWRQVSYPEVTEEIIDTLLEPLNFAPVIETLQRVSEAPEREIIEDECMAVTHLGTLLSMTARQIKDTWEGARQGSPVDPEVQTRILKACKGLLSLADTSKVLEANYKMQLRIAASSGASLAGSGALHVPLKRPASAKTTSGSSGDGDSTLPEKIYILTNSTVVESLGILAESWSALTGAPWGGRVPIDQAPHLTMGPGTFFLRLNNLSGETSQVITANPSQSVLLGPLMPALLQFITLMGTVTCAIVVFAQRGLPPQMASIALGGYFFSQQISVLALAYATWLHVSPPSQSEVEALRVHACAAARSWAKALRYLNAAPLDAWTDACKREMGTLDTPGMFLKIAMGISIQMLASLEKLPDSQGSSRELAAMALDVVNALGTIPPEMYEKGMERTHPAERVGTAAALAGVLLKSNSFLEPAYAAGDVAGLRALCALCNGENDSFKLIIEGFMPSKMVQVLEKLVDALKAAPKAEAMEEKSAKARAMLLGALPCACLVCSTLEGLEPHNSKLCSGCRVVKYCGARDQKADWKYHKIACKALSKK